MKKILFNLYQRFVHLVISYYPITKNPALKNIHNIIYKYSRPGHVNIYGFRLFLNPEDKILAETLIQNNVWEPYETLFFQEHLRERNVILDIGANIGYYTLLFSKLVGNKGKVFAFEPDPDNFKILSKNISYNRCQNVILVNKAVSNETGKTGLFLDEMNKGDHRSYNSYDGRKSIEVESVSLDDYFKHYQGEIDYIKIDTQGAEGMVIKGMLRFLKIHKNVKIISEFWPMGLSKSGIEPKVYLDLLIKAGFKLIELSEISKKLAPTSINKLLSTYTIENKDYTNLVCIR